MDNLTFAPEWEMVFWFTLFIAMMMGFSNGMQR